MKKANRMLSVFIILSLFIGVGTACAGEAEKININTASEKELIQLNGVGPAKAAEIVKYRETNGPFEHSEDLMNVKGIGVKLFRANKDRIAVGHSETKVSEEEKSSGKEKVSGEEAVPSDTKVSEEKTGQSEKNVSEEKKEVSKKKKKKASDDDKESSEE